MTYSAIAVADAFLQLARRDGELISPVKLQKLVYFAHGWHMAYLGAPLTTEAFEAWPYGPVTPVLHDALSECHGVKINDTIGDGVLLLPRGQTEVDRCSRSAQLIESVWDVYKRYTAVELSNATHLAGSAWSQTWREGATPPYAEISNALIRDDFNSRRQSASVDDDPAAN